MQRKIIWIGALAICIMMGIPVYAQQDYSIVYDLYYNLMLDPESGDGLIQKNQNLFNSRFYSCMDVVQQKAEQASQQHMAACNNIIDPHAKAQCEKNDEGAKLWSWIKAIRAACSGDMLWSETTAGKITIVGKKEMEKVAPGQYEKIINDSMPQLRPILICK